MKQPYSFKTWHSLISMLFVMMCCLPETVAAQVSFSDDFNYPAGNLHEQGGWVRYGKNAEDPSRCSTSNSHTPATTTTHRLSV